MIRNIIYPFASNSCERIDLIFYLLALFCVHDKKALLWMVATLVEVVACKLLITLYATKLDDA